ncbi:MAG: hypothetical protein CMJ65_03610 [Planctomycetaceae bacterium]|jgi:segregation and condensation protein B|nr:hypothetical protein [Planctomycetaceae bacterium]MDP7275011.1 SMC-Scp complex subunit ScpB [Planctomycetaceae bacterium]
MPDESDFRIDPAHPEPDNHSGPQHRDPATVEAGNGDWFDQDLESAYRQALEANEAVEEEIGPGIEPTDWPGPDQDDQEEPQAAVEEEPEQLRVTSGQVIEAALFVGGQPLTAKKLGTLIGPDADKTLVEEEIEKLNELYNREERPYEIRLEEGGYRLQLREEFDPVRDRVFGLGPKEVRLSQEQLEVLAIVAYEQPASRQEIEAHGLNNVSGMLRQLLRRRLIQIERGNNPRRDITYRTTPRFLEVFNITDIHDLPTPREIELR